VKLKELKIDIFGTELKIKIAASEKVAQENPESPTYQSLSDYLTPELKPHKIKTLDEL